MSYVTPSTLMTGCLVTAARWNQDVVSNPEALNPGGWSVVLGDGVSVIPTGSALDVEVPFNCTLSAWGIYQSPSGSLEVTLCRMTYAGFPATAGVFVGVAAGGGMAGTSVRLVGQDFSLVAALTHATYSRSDLWALYNPQQVGPCTLTIPFNAAEQHAAGFVVVRGVDVANPIRSSSTGGAGPNGDGEANIAIASAVDDLVLDHVFYGDNVGTNPSVGPNQTEQYHARSGKTGPTNQSESAVSTEAGAATVSMTWSGNGTRVFSHCVVSIRPLVGKPNQAVVLV